jgi:hypothetical protein
MSYETLYGLLPQYEGVGDLAAKAQEINSYAGRGEISVEEQFSLLQDLVHTQLIIDEAQSHEQKLFVDQLVKVLANLPMPS